MKIKTWIFLILTISLAAAGCNWFQKTDLGAGPKPADLDNVDPAVAAKRINFVPGSQLEIKQITALDGGNRDHSRIITIERFAPLYYARLSWSISGESTGEIIGSVEDLNIGNSHKLFLPAYWPPQKISFADVSGIWMSKEIYEELDRTKNSTIYTGILDAALYGKMADSKEFSAALAAVQKDVLAAGDKVDPDLTIADQNHGELTLSVNGKDVKVKTIKARNWYGEFEILDNVQNPLVLSFKYAPQNDEAQKEAGVADFLKNLLSYSVVRLDNVQ